MKAILIGTNGWDLFSKHIHFYVFYIIFFALFKLFHDIAENSNKL